MKRAHSSIALIAVATGLVVAGCGSSSNSSSTSGTAASGNSSSGAGSAYGGGQSQASSSSASSGAATSVSLGTASGVGKVLVDSKGMTLYYFEKDQKGSGQSKCEGPCAQAWPPLTTSGQPKAMSGVKASMLGTIKRSDGGTQVTYAGWPLYTFIEDKAPGQDNGTDSKAFGASWYPLHANGEKAGE